MSSGYRTVSSAGAGYNRATLRRGVPKRRPGTRKVLIMGCEFTRSIAWVVALSLGGLCTPAAVAAQDLGQIFVQVVNQAGDSFTGLTLEDFTVLEDGVECTVVSAEPGTQPMKIALLADNSEMLNRASALTSLRRGLDEFLTSLPEQHEVALATIGANIGWRVDFTTDRDELKASAAEIFVNRGGGPILLDGIKETWERRFEDEESWPIFVVVVTDGPESSSNMNQNEYAELVNELISNGVTVHIMVLSTRGGSVVTDYAINLTDNTGGLYEVFGAGTRLATALPELATRLGTHYDDVSQRYRVVYERPDPPGTSVSVGVARAGAVAQPFIDRRMP